MKNLFPKFLLLAAICFAGPASAAPKKPAHSPGTAKAAKRAEAEHRRQHVHQQWRKSGSGKTSIEFRAGEALVRMKPGKKPPKGLGGKSREVSGEAALIAWSPEDSTFSQFKARAALAADVADVEPNLKVTSEAVSNGNGRAHARRNRGDRLDAVKAGLARLKAKGKLGAGARKARIAIFDTGIDDVHPDLKGQVVTGVNTFNVFPLEGMDSLEMADTSTRDYQGHGTLVSGVIAARENETSAGINPDADLYAVKVLNGDGLGTLANVLAGLEWAIRKNVDIINMSIGTTSDSPLLHEAIKKAVSKGILVVASAGNQFAPLMSYPAAYPEVFSVGSMASDGAISRFSNFSERTDIFAPGEELSSTSFEGGYRAFSGTSAAAAYVSGYVSLLVANGFPAAKAAKVITQTAIERMSQANPFEYAAKELNERFVLSAIGEEDSVQIAVRHFEITPDYANGKVKLRLELANISSRASPSLPVSITISGEKAATTRVAGALQTLRPGASGVLTLDIPVDDSLKSLALPSEYSLPIRIRLSAEGRLAPGMLEKKVEWFFAPNPKRHEYKILAMWEEIATADGKEKPTGVKIKVQNTGRTAIDSLGFGFTVWTGTHEAVWSAPAAQILPPVPAGSLAPGEIRVLSLAWQPLDSLNIYTLEAHVTAGNGQDKRYLRAVTRNQDGMFRPEYSQLVHRDLVRQAVGLLESQGIHLPDLALNSPYYDNAGGYKEWGAVPDGIDVGNLSHDYTRYFTESDLDQYYDVTNATLVSGAHDCDGIDLTTLQSGLNTWNSHFWVVDDGDYGTGNPQLLTGIPNDGALKKIELLLKGGSGFWNHGAIDNYRHGNKTAAWYFLGHALHLIGDISLGSHVNDANSHGVWGDVYHNWMDAGNFTRFSYVQAMNQGGYIDPYQPAAEGNPIRFLAFTTAQVGNSFPRFGLQPFSGGKGGNRNFGSAGYPHYDNYMKEVWSKMPKRPWTTQDYGADEVWDDAPNFCFWCSSECQYVDWVGLSERRADCDRDGHKDFDNTDGTTWYPPPYSIDGQPSDHDGDISANGGFAYPYAIRAAAGLLYYFAVETGQYVPPRNAPPPIIAGFGSSVAYDIPNILTWAGMPGNEILVYGYHFHPVPAKNEVRFNGQLAEVVKYNNLNAGTDYAYIIVKIPDGATSGTVSVTVEDKKSVTANTVVIAPRVASISPNSAIPGETITLYGQNMQNTLNSGGMQAYFIDAFGQTVQGTVTESDQLHLTVRIPTGQAAVRGLYLLWGPGFWIYAPGFIIRPQVSSISPTHGKVGDVVTITGLELNQAPYAALTVTFAGGAVANIDYKDRATVKVKVPAGAKSGPIVLREAVANTDLETSSLPVQFGMDPIATALSPASGAPGAAVTISGSNFIPATGGQNRVWFGGQEATVTGATETQLTVLAPEGGATGAVTLQSLGLSATAPVFTYVPVLTSLSKASGFTGQTLTLTGDYFPAASAAQVWFGTEPATVLAAAPKLLTVRVPKGVATVNVKVTVNASASAALPFKFLNIIPAISLLLN